MSQFEDGSYGSLTGVALMGKIMAGRCKMNYTRAVAGKGYIPEGKTPKTMTEPADYVMEAKIVSVSNPVDGECQVTVQINSSDVEKGFYVTCIVLFAEDPDEGEVPYTYLSLENEPEWIRPSSSIVGKLATFDLIAAVGDVDTVTAVIDANSIATKATVERMIAEAILQRDIVIPATEWLENVAGGEGGVYIDIVQKDVTESMIPIVSIYPNDMSAARGCGMNTTVQTINGAVRFFADKIPKKEIKASLVLLKAYYGIAGEITEGGYGLDIEEFYKNYVATNEEVEKVLNEVFEK